jgi:L-threonylcarbamoyladenylate synthase
MYFHLVHCAILASSGKLMRSELPQEVKRQIKRGVEIIRKGGLVAFPTDTLYGLGAGAYIESAVERIFQVKRRSRDMALPLLLADTSQIPEIAKDIPAYAWRLIERFLPGGLTLVVPRTQKVKDIITAGGDSVAFRIPDHPVARALIRGSGMPVIGTSANVSGQPNPLTYEEVYRQIGDKVDLVINGGPTPGGKESTVVDVTGDIPAILRLGVVSRAQLEEVIKIK